MNTEEEMESAFRRWLVLAALGDKDALTVEMSCDLAVWDKRCGVMGVSAEDFEMTIYELFASGDMAAPSLCASVLHRLRVSIETLVAYRIRSELGAWLKTSSTFNPDDPAWQARAFAEISRVVKNMPLPGRVQLVAGRIPPWHASPSSRTDPPAVRFLLACSCSSCWVVVDSA